TVVHRWGFLEGEYVHVSRCKAVLLHELARAHYGSGQLHSVREDVHDLLDATGARLRAAAGRDGRRPSREHDRYVARADRRRLADDAHGRPAEAGERSGEREGRKSQRARRAGTSAEELRQLEPRIPDVR